MGFMVLPLIIPSSINLFLFLSHESMLSTMTLFPRCALFSVMAFIECSPRYQLLYFMFNVWFVCLKILFTGDVMFRKTYFLINILCFFIALILLYKSVEAVGVNSSLQLAAEKVRIVIDCGHGGEDGGAVSVDGLLEKDVNLQIGLVLEKLFVSGGFEVVMIRNTDTAIYDETAKTLREKKVSDLHNRSDVCNSDERNVYISIHQNKFEDARYSGAQVFYSKNNVKSKELAESVRKSVNNLILPENKRECKEATESIYVLNKALVPAILVECGFLSNYQEAKLLSTEQYRNQMAYSIYCGFLEYYYT